MFLPIWIRWVRGFSKIYNLLKFAQFLVAGFRNKYLDFCKFAIFFADYWSKAQGLSINESNVIDLYENKKIEGGRGDQF